MPFAALYGNKDAESLTASEAEAYARKPEWSASYRNGMLGALVTAFRWAERGQIISRFPLRGIQKPPKPLGVMNKGENRYGCREPHFSTIGMITPPELLKLVKGMTAVEDGFLNRFLLCGVKRTRYLPQGSDWRSVAMRFAPMLREAMEKASACCEPFALHEDASDCWDRAYRRLEERRTGDYGSVVARGSVHALKVAMVYAALDGALLIQESHLRAALALIAHADAGEVLNDDDFLRLLKEMPTDDTAKDGMPFLERLAML